MAMEDLLGVSEGFMPRYNNYLLYNNPEQPGRMTYITTNLDISLGITVCYLNSMLNGDVIQHAGFDFQPIIRHLFSNSDILQNYINIFKKLATELLHPSVMMPRIDSIVEMIRPDVDWDQSLKRVGQDLLNSLIYQPKQTLYLFTPQVKSGEEMQKIFDRFPFYQAINDPLDCDDYESVKGFINRKVKAVISFYGLEEIE